jgi:hypothetical protein
MVVDAVIAIGNDDRLNMIGIKKVNLLGNAFVFFLPIFFCLTLHVIL